MAKSAWGIEAGTSSIKAVKLTHDGKGGVTLDDIALIDLANYYVEGGDERTALVGGLAAFVADKGIKPTDSVYVSLPSRNQISRVVSLPPVGENAIRETIAHEARGQIPIKLEDAVWDYHLIDSSDPGELLVNLYAVKRDVIDGLIGLCQSAGLNVSGIQLAPLGIYNFVKYEMDLEVSESCVCIDIGADNTDLVIIDGEKTWLRTVPFAGNDITKALLMRFKKLSPAQAEKLKRKAAESKDAGKIFEAMKPPLKEMVGEVYRCVGFYKNQNDDAQLNKLVMMGNGSKLFNITKFFEQQLQYEVHRVEELSNIMPSRAVDPSEVQDNVQSLVVAMGLALQAVGVPGMIATNLLPLELVKEEALKKVRPVAILAGAIVFLAGLAVFLMGLGPKSDASGQITTLNGYANTMRTQQGELDQEIDRSDFLNGQVITQNNAVRGDRIAYLSYLFLRQTINDFEEENEAGLMWAMRQRHNSGSPPQPRFDEGAMIVNISQSTFEELKEESAEDEYDEFDDPYADDTESFEDESTPKVWLRSVTASISVNLAIKLDEGGGVVGDAAEVMADLKERIEERLDVLFAAELDRNDFEREFGDADFASSMMELRGLVVEELPKASEEDVEDEYADEDEAGPTLRAREAQYKLEDVSGGASAGRTAEDTFMVYGGENVETYISPASERWVAQDRFFPYTLTLSCTSQPWRPSEMRGETTGEDVLEGN